MHYPYLQHVVVWFLIVVEASSALPGGSSNHNNGRIFSSTIGPNRTWATSWTLLSTIRKQQDEHETPLLDNNPFQNLYAKFGKRVNFVTRNKDPYEFGDLTKWLDAEARSEIKEVQSEISSFAKIAKKIKWGKRREEEEDGEDHSHIFHATIVAVELFKFLRSIVLVNSIRLTVKLGIERQVLTRLPSFLLLELIHLILDWNYGPLILRLVATELDKRFKLAIFGDEDYNFGDLTKRAVAKYTGKDQYEFGDLTKRALGKFTGKKQYEFGDITKVILERAQASEKGTAKYKDQVQKELHALEDDVRISSADSKNSPPRKRRGNLMPTLRWFRM